MRAPLLLAVVAAVLVTPVAGSAKPRPVIELQTPRAGALVHSGFRVSGTANVFEANLTVKLYDARGRLLVRKQVTASCGTGCRGRFSARVAFHVGKRQSGTLVVHDDDAAGFGHPPHLVRRRLILAPR